MTDAAEDFVSPELQPTATAQISTPAAATTAMSILAALSVSHGLNDTIQALIPSIYPMLRDNYSLSLGQIGGITAAIQITSSLLQPVVGSFTDKRPQPLSLAVGMTITLVGLLCMAFAHSYLQILLAAALVGGGSAIFHPEASRLAHLAAGNRHGFAQSLFQVGGNFGSSLGPLLAAWIIVPNGQKSVAWFSAIALVAIVLLLAIGRWYRTQLQLGHTKRKSKTFAGLNLSRGRTALAMAVLMILIASKFFYLISLTNYYTFYLIQKFHVSVQASQIYLFIFLLANAVGTFAGGPLGDKFGRRAIIWVSILGVAPFSLLLPHVGLEMTIVLSIFAGLILASAFSAILVFAQELMPGRVGTVAGLFFGFAFGVSGIAAAALGKLADHTSIEFVFNVCAYLPLIGLLTALLPSDRRTA